MIQDDSSKGCEETRRKITLLGKEFTLPRSRRARIAIGISLMVLGCFGFLPVLGFWMIPLGLLVLSVDIAIIRRWRRRGEVKIGRWRNGKNGNGNGNGRAGNGH